MNMINGHEHEHKHTNIEHEQLTWLMDTNNGHEHE